MSQVEKTLCRDCRDLQREVIATRMVGKTPVCDAHMRSRLGMPAPSAPQEESTMPKARTDVDWSRISREKAAGESARSLTKKYGVHVSSIYLHAQGNGHRHAGGQKRRSPRAAEVASTGR